MVGGSWRVREGGWKVLGKGDRSRSKRDVSLIHKAMVRRRGGVREPRYLNSILENARSQANKGLCYSKAQTHCS